MKGQLCTATKASWCRREPEVILPSRSAASFLTTCSRNGITHSAILLLLSSFYHHNLQIKLWAWPGLWVCKTWLLYCSCSSPGDPASPHLPVCGFSRCQSKDPPPWDSIITSDNPRRRSGQGRKQRESSVFSSQLAISGSQNKAGQRAWKLWAASDEEVVNSEEGNTIGNGLLMALQVLFEKQYKERKNVSEGISRASQRKI